MGDEEEEGLETFTERFVRLTAGLSRKELGQILDLTPGAVIKLLNGDTQSLKAHGAIALARRLGVSVEYLAERGPLPRDERQASIRLFAEGLLTTRLSADGTAAPLPADLGQWMGKIERMLQTNHDLAQQALGKAEAVELELHQRKDRTA